MDARNSWYRFRPLRGIIFDNDISTNKLIAFGCTYKYVHMYLSTMHSPCRYQPYELIPHLRTALNLHTNETVVRQGDTFESNLSNDSLLEYLILPVQVLQTNRKQLDFHSFVSIDYYYFLNFPPALSNKQTNFTAEISLIDQLIPFTHQQVDNPPNAPERCGIYSLSMCWWPQGAEHRPLLHSVER